MAAGNMPVAAAAGQPFAELRAVSRSATNKWTAHYAGGMKADDFAEIHNDLLTLDRRNDPDELAGLRLALWQQRDPAKQIVQTLRTYPTVAARTALAEILLYIAVGDNKYSSIYKQVPSNLSDTLADIAADLMTRDPDPFVSGIAEQALAAKVNRENDGPQLWWPKEDPPQWFRTWYAQAPSSFIEHDYVRQAVQQNIHRTVESLSDSANEIAKRMEAFAADIASAGVDHRQIATKLANVRTAAHAVEMQTDLTAARKAWLRLRLAARDLVMISPDLDFAGFVYVKRRNHLLQHNIANNEPQGGRFPPGTDILRKENLNPAEPPQSLLGDRLGPGSIRGMDLFYDADRVVFSFTPQPVWGPKGPWESNRGCAEESNLHQMNVDGTALRRLTNDPLHADQAPCYLPNGDIVFASSRSDIGSECGPWDQHAVVMNLYKVAIAPDGRSEVRRLTHNKDFDHYPHVLNTGVIGFTRWDYQERHFYYPHTLWSCRPDGTQSDLIYKSHISDGPHSLRDAMPIPGSSKVFAIACGHHEIPEGSVALVNLNTDPINPAAIEYVTPMASPTEGGYGRDAKCVPQGGVRDAAARETGGFYHTPWPLSQRSMLIGATYHLPVSCGAALYYIDVFGNKELIARDLIYELIHPKALKPRKKPPILPDTTDPARPYALLYINDVYEGLEGVERGLIKYIRIFSKVNWPYPKTPCGEMRWFVDQGSSPTFGFWNWSPTRVIGTVPVHEDGSAYFKAPVDMSLSFQALDGHFREVRRMRSHVEFQPGEVRSCIGCHETRANATGLAQKTLTAARHAPSVPMPPAWGDAELLDYVAHVQPVFEKYCVSCHGAEKPAGSIELTDRRDAFGFLQSYRSLFGIKYGQKLPIGGDPWYQRFYPQEYKDHAVTNAAAVRDAFKQFVDGAAPGQLVKIISRRGDAHITQPFEAGSYKSRIIMVLFDDPDHASIREAMPPGDWEALVTFVDQNCPATGWFYARKDEHGNDLNRPMRVDIEYADPWQNRQPNDENGRILWPAQQTRLQ